MKAKSLIFLKKDQGFTMVELLVVIIILVILTSIAIPSYVIIKDRARETATKTEMNNIAKALEIYITQKYSYPSGDDFPDALVTAEIMNLTGNDAWGMPYNYTSNNSSSYVLKSFGINKMDGGNDDITFVNGMMIENGAYHN